MSFFRYPGGKRKMRSDLVDRIASEAIVFNSPYEYREPFFGGGGIGVLFTEHVSPSGIWINDKDEGISCLWTSLIRHPDLLKKKILDFTPSVGAFDDFVLRLKSGHPDWNSEESIMSFGFMKLAVHQLSYSGLGLKSGGPLGGRSQESPYKIDCRWSPVYMCKKVDKIRSVLVSSKIRGDRCWCDDFNTIIENDDCPAVMYIDPPYYGKGNDLYYFGFTMDDHVRLAESLRKSKHRWVLSYDDCDEIKKLYGWAKIERVVVNYSITATGSANTEKESRWKYEYIISSAV